MKLEESFYQRKDVVKIARELLGKILFTRVKKSISAGIIVETEAYSHTEKGCHAYGGMTARNRVLYEAGGISYVYLCYGIHNMFNVVTNVEGVAEAILVRAIQPYRGEGHMARRMNSKSTQRIGSGPGKLTKALGIDRSFNGKYLLSDDVWVEDLGIKVKKQDIIATTRIGIDYAGNDAFLPWRFIIRDNPWISKP